MAYHYEKHTTTTSKDGNIQSRSSVIVRELDDGEVGILMAGNNSILDPTLTPRMLASPTTNYDVESDALPPSPDDNYDSDNADGTTDDDEEEEEEEEEETWFPALRHNSWIHGLDDEDDDEPGNDDGNPIVEKMLETLFATEVLEKEDKDDDDDDDDDEGEGEHQNDNGGRRLAQHSHRPHKSRRTTRSRSRQDQRPASEEEEEGDGDDEVGSLVPLDIICVVLND